MLGAPWDNFGRIKATMRYFWWKHNKGQFIYIAFQIQHNESPPLLVALAITATWEAGSRVQTRV